MPFDFGTGDDFIKRTMELRGDRICVIVDRTVWDLYSKKLTAWASSVGLKLELIIAVSPPHCCVM